MKKKLKKVDNPVPSLDKIKEFLYENPHMFQNSPYNYKELCFEGIKEILQNGVESNKEQPEDQGDITEGYCPPGCTCSL